MGSSANPLIPPPPGFELDEAFRQRQAASSIQQHPPPPPGFQLEPPAGYTPSKPDLPASLLTNETLASALPYIGATAATMAGPPGWLAGLGMAGLGAGIGSGAEQGLRKAEAMPGAPQSMGDFGKQLGEDVLYKGVLPEAGGKIINTVLAKTLGRYFNPERLYQSGLKPAGTEQSSAADIVRTGIQEKIPLSEQAVRIARNRIDSLQGQIEGVIQSTPADIPPGQYVSNIENRMDSLRAKWSKDATLGPKFVDQIDQAEREFLLNHGNPQPITKQVSIPSKTFPHTPQFQNVTIQPADMSLAELRRQAKPLDTADAQAIKKQTYETIRTKAANAYGADVHPGLDIRIRKQLGGAMREELANIYPELNKLNPREGALIELEDALERFAHREMNKQATPYFIYPIAGAMFGGGAMAGHPGAGVGAAAFTIGGHLLRTALEDPAIKSRIAIALDAAGRSVAGKVTSKVGPFIPAAGIRLTEDALIPPPMPQPPQ